jgi:hypothetical protein
MREQKNDYWKDYSERVVLTVDLFNKQYTKYLTQDPVLEDSAITS